MCFTRFAYLWRKGKSRQVEMEEWGLFAGVIHVDWGRKCPPVASVCRSFLFHGMEENGQQKGKEQ